MPFEVITCPLSACFLGMSSTQADVARSLRLSDARDPQFDRDDARAAYAVLAGPSQTGDGEPSFFDRMFRRVGRSPLSRGRAEATATLFLAALKEAGVLVGERPSLTTLRDEEFHGELAPSAIEPHCMAAADDAWSGGKTSRLATLALDGDIVIYLPVPLTRVVRGVPHDVGSTIGLVAEIERLLADLGAGPTPDARVDVVASVEPLLRAARAAQTHQRVVVVTR